MALYLIILAVTVIVLIVIFSKDDSFLKFAKLDELNEVREKLLTETSNQADLLKHYMTCVTEI